MKKKKNELKEEQLKKVNGGITCNQYEGNNGLNPPSAVDRGTVEGHGNANGGRRAGIPRT